MKMEFLKNSDTNKVIGNRMEALKHKTAGISNWDKQFVKTALNKEEVKVKNYCRSCWS